MKRILFSLLAAASIAAGTVVAGAPAAEAAQRNGSCDSGEFCYYYNTDQKGSVSDHSVSLGNYGTSLRTCYVFKGQGKGKGLCIKNNAASVWNRTNQAVTVYYNSRYGGKTQTIAPGAKANLAGKMRNNNASHKIGAGSGSTSQPKPTKDQPQPNQPQPTGGMQNPYSGSNGANGGWTPRAAWLRDKIKKDFGVSCTTYATGDRSSEHSNGNGLDCWGTMEQRRKITQWVAKNARSLEVYYVIHEQRIWSLPRAGEGFRKMKDRGGVTQNHFDHIHISMQHPGNEY